MSRSPPRLQGYFPASSWPSLLEASLPANRRVRLPPALIGHCFMWMRLELPTHLRRVTRNDGPHQLTSVTLNDAQHCYRGGDRAAVLAQTSRSSFRNRFPVRMPIGSRWRVSQRPEVVELVVSTNAYRELVRVAIDPGSRHREGRRVCSPQISSTRGCKLNQTYRWR
jgi:hypothetical protein